MCVYSMVHDYYKPAFDPWIAQPTTIIPLGPAPTTTPPAGTISVLTTEQLAELRQLIDEYKQAVEAAKKVDILTKRPDCPDPDKQKLEERVGRLEMQLEELRRDSQFEKEVSAAFKPKRKKTKKNAKKSK